MTRFTYFRCLVLAGMVFAAPSRALVNPRVQPETFYKAYRNVMLTEVTERSEEPPVLTLTIRDVAKGEAVKGGTLRMRPAAEAEMDFIYALEEGQSLVIFSERNGPRVLRDRLLIYTGGGSWLAGRLVEEGTVLEISGNADEGVIGDDIHYGVFNGRVDLLWQMCREFSAGTAYFPSIPFVKFRAETLAALEEAPGGMAVWDLNADGALDVLVGTSSEILWLENSGDGYRKHGLKAGLEVSGGGAIALAPLQDGLGVLHGNHLYRLKEGQLESIRTFDVGGEVITPGFADLNNDGSVDLLFSVREGGLRAFLNAGEDQFEEASGELGLRDELLEPEGSGRFLVGDWNRDGQADLVYLAGPGLILQQREGRFTPVPLGMEESYAFGGAAFGDLVTPGVSGIFVAVPGEHMVFEYREDAFPFDLLPSGNELRETNASMFLPVIEDLNMDGYPDVFTASGEDGGSYHYVANRGYGSFMMSDKYGSNLFPKPEAGATATSLSVGDFNRDGATDLLLGTAEGKLILLVNETLKDRPTEVDPLAGRSETQKQVQAKIVRFQLPVNGEVPGAHLDIRDARKQLVFSKPVVGLMGSGSQSAPEVIAVLREPGTYSVSVLYPNGEQKEGMLELQPDSPRVQVYRFPSE